MPKFREAIAVQKSPKMVTKPTATGYQFKFSVELSPITFCHPVIELHTGMYQIYKLIKALVFLPMSRPQLGFDMKCNESLTMSSRWE